MPHQESTFQSFDGTELFYRAWVPPITPTGAIVFLHRGHEHSGRLLELMKDIHLEDFAHFAWDSRGHGRSPGERGYAEDLSVIVQDLEYFVRHIQKEYEIPIENVAIVAHSVAGVVAGLWVHDYAPRIRALVLATPAFRVKLYVPFAIPGLRVLLKVWRALGKKTPFVKSYVKGELLTHDADEAKRYDTDPLISKQIAVNILLDLYDGATRLLKDAGAITVPTLLLCARADWVVKNKPQRQFFNGLSSTVKQVQVFKDFYHALFHEKERIKVIQATREFILDIFESPHASPDLKHAHMHGYTQEEHAWLKAGSPWFSCKRFWYGCQKFLMKTLGQLSAGIRIGWQHGFDSGQSLDYVYRNKASGVTPLGKLIDRTYLDAIGWKGIRQRKINLERTLEQALEKVKQEGTSKDAIRIADIAGGPGRYLIDFAEAHKEDGLEILIRDWSEEGLKQGRSIAESKNLSNIRYERADAFNLEDLAKLPSDLKILVVSGLYELFPDNIQIARSLEGLAKACPQGSYLIYTNQPWHPQVEMIAEVLINRDKQPWVMRRRTQAEMDDLVSQAGFQKLDMRIDSWGIFSVSLAQRV